MNARPSVETWNRGELEDKFYRQYDQLISLKKKNNELEKKLRLSSSKIRQVLQNGENSETDERCRELERENRLLAQKLKALRHQLINYTRPQAHNTTLNFLTSRSTARTHNTQRDPQNIQSTVDKTLKIAEKEIGTPKTRDNNETAEKSLLIKLHRENREKLEEIEDLHFQLAKTDEKLQSLRAEYDKVVIELETARKRLKEARNHGDDRVDQYDGGTTAIVEKELEILREENRVLKFANDRFVSNSLVHEQHVKSTTIELQQLQKHVQDVELKIADVGAENKRLTKKIKDAESDKRHINDKYRKFKEKVAAKEAQRQGRKEITATDDFDIAPSPIVASPVPKIELTREKRRRSKASQSTVLERLFEDVASIVDSHVSRSESSASLDNEPPTNAKWRQLYEEIYSELEKVRNLLLIQHRINERHQREMGVLNEYNEYNKHEYEKKLAEYVAELNRRAKRIEILENQLRLIAAGATDFDHSVLTDSNSKLKKIEFTSISTNELTLRVTRLIVNDVGLKITNSIEPMMFISLEFFDFELQTTPIIKGPESRFDFSTVYEIVVSNLFIHYIEKEGIAVEIFEVNGASYEQIGTGIISLKKLLEAQTPARINGQLKLMPCTGNKEHHLGTLEYSLEVPFDLIKALKTQKKRITASSFLPSTIEDKGLYNELEVHVHRCSNISKIASGLKKVPSIYVVYQVYDLPPHLTAAVSDNENPIFDDVKSYSLPVGTALHRYLKTHELVFHAVEETTNSNGKQRALGSVKLPLFVLARNQKLQGTFPFVDEENVVTEASIDVSIHWKYAYTFNDENLDVEAPVAVNFPKMKPKEAEIQKNGAADVKPPQLVLVKSSSLDAIEKKPTFFESSPSNSSLEGTVIENVPNQKSETSPRREDSSSDGTYVVDDDDIDSARESSSVITSDKETDVGPGQIATTETRVEDSHVTDAATDKEAEATDSQPRPESSPVELLPIERKSDKEHDSDESSDFSVSEIDDVKNLKGLKEELEKLDKEETDSDNDFATDEDREKTPVPEKQERLPPIPLPRRLSKVRGVDFTEPLHSSIPPSEESSVAGSVEGTPRGKEQGAKAFPKSIPNIAAPATPSVIKQHSLEKQVPDPKTQGDCSMTIRLGRLSIIEHSPLLHEEYDRVNVFIEWNFLDFANELCETPESVPIPRNTWKVETFECERVYELNTRRIALLKQWIETQSRLNFNLVTDPEDDAGCDDLGVAQLDLGDVINSSIHSVIFHDVNGEPIAALDLTVIYSDELTKYLTGENQ